VIFGDATCDCMSKAIKDFDSVGHDYQPTNRNSNFSMNCLIGKCIGKGTVLFPTGTQRPSLNCTECLEYQVAYHDDGGGSRPYCTFPCKKKGSCKCWEKAADPLSTALNNANEIINHASGGNRRVVE